MVICKCRWEEAHREEEGTAKAKTVDSKGPVPKAVEKLSSCEGASVYYSRKRLGVEPLHLLTQEARDEARTDGDLKRGEEFDSNDHTRFEQIAKQDRQVSMTFHLRLVAVALQQLSTHSPHAGSAEVTVRAEENLVHSAG